jgi:hypothetical protein
MSKPESRSRLKAMGLVSESPPSRRPSFHYSLCEKPTAFPRIYLGSTSGSRTYRPRLQRGSGSALLGTGPRPAASDNAYSSFTGDNQDRTKTKLGRLLFLGFWWLRGPSNEPVTTYTAAGLMPSTSLAFWVDHKRSIAFSRFWHKTRHELRYALKDASNDCATSWLASCRAASRCFSRSNLSEVRSPSLVFHLAHWNSPWVRRERPFPVFGDCFRTKLKR